MSKSLVIVESPAKVKTINKFLGKEFLVKSSVGHIRDLAKSGVQSTEKAGAKKKTGNGKATAEEKLVQRMGVDPSNGWVARYEILPGKEKVLKALKDAAKNVDVIYLATDLDREGEAIAWHLREAIGGDINRYKRVTFTEITQKAVQEAFSTPGTLNIDRVNAQQARRFLDRVVGYMLSPLLWQKVARGLSAGRVQSVAVRLISEREHEIHAFKPEEYWEIHAALKNQKNEDITFELAKYNGKAFKAGNEKEAMLAVQALHAGPFVVKQVERKPSKSKPGAPFITSSLQQAASVRLGYGVKKTMVLAQHLYEAGYITYMRTDSTNLSKDAILQVRDFIAKKFGPKYLPETEQVYTSKKSAQEAHEAIRPTDVLLHPDKIEALVEKDAAKLYQLIWRQFVACQMTQAEYDSTSVVVECKEYELRTRGRVLRFDGFLRVQPQIKSKKDEDILLPEIQEGQNLKKGEILPSQHFTKPAPRYTEASLVRELEKRGIGRPSTYTAIISTIQDRGYVRLERRRFFCLKMGDIVTNRLLENFDDLMDYGFTASLEEGLDKIAAGELDWRGVLDEFYQNFTHKLEDANDKMRGNLPTPTQLKCPECGKPMNIRTARTGVFLSCSGYALPVKERCKGTINLITGEETVSLTDVEDDEGNVQEIQSKRRCKKCDTAMDVYLIDEQRRIHVCGNNPECPGYELEEGKFKIKGYDGPLIECDKCGDQMQLKTGRFGKYFGCNRAPDCKNTRKLLRSGEAAPPKSPPVPMRELPCSESDGYFVLRDGAAGLFLAASTFPKSRETRKPQVADLLRHKAELDPKYLFLTEAPESDKKGRPTIIRFNRKSREHYVMSEEDGKPTGFAAFFQNGSWVVEENHK